MSLEEITSWRPTKSSEFIPASNAELIQEEKERLRNGSWLKPLAFLSPFGTAKTSAMRYLAMCVCCPSFRTDGEPCSTCEGCRSQTPLCSGDVHLYRHWEVDCSTIGQEELRELLKEAIAYKQSVLSLDEFRGLERESAQSMLLKFAEDYRGMLMLGITAESHDQAAEILTVPLLDRVRLISLARPTVDEMAAFLAEQAAAWEVRAVDNSIYRPMVRAANQSFRKCLEILAEAKAAGGLTLKTVEKVLGLEEGWEEDLLDD